MQIKKKHTSGLKQALKIHTFNRIHVANTKWKERISWHSEDRATWYILITKPTRCTNFSNLFLEWNSTCFGQVFCPSSGVFRCTHSNGVCHSGYADCLLASSQHNLYDIYILLCVQCWTPDDGQRECPKHVQFHSKNKFEKSVHLVGFVIRRVFLIAGLLAVQQTTSYVQNLQCSVRRQNISVFTLCSRI